MCFRGEIGSSQVESIGNSIKKMAFSKMALFIILKMKFRNISVKDADIVVYKTDFDVALIFATLLKTPN